MTRIVFLRHFETQIDEEKPVSEWGLTEGGERAMQKLLQSTTIDGLRRVYSSPEHKARYTAQAVAAKQDIDCRTVDVLRKADRSGEGFIEDPDEYVRMVGELLRNPTVPFEWEDRIDVENRIRTFLDTVGPDEGRVMAVSHGIFLSVLFSRHRDEKPLAFWKGLDFGETIEVDRAELVEVFET